MFYMHYAVSIPFIILLGSNMKNIIKTFLSIFICTRKLILTCTVQSIMLFLCALRLLICFYCFAKSIEIFREGKVHLVDFFALLGFNCVPLCTLQEIRVVN